MKEKSKAKRIKKTILLSLPSVEAMRKIVDRMEAAEGRPVTMSEVISSAIIKMEQSK